MKNPSGGTFRAHCFQGSDYLSRKVSGVPSKNGWKRRMVEQNGIESWAHFLNPASQLQQSFDKPQLKRPQLRDRGFGIGTGLPRKNTKNLYLLATSDSSKGSMLSEATPKNGP